ncbi:tyrosine-type recombinase/integrase [Candidatus Woesearchaeota archaeon]|nr:tyrosine-type recombinase/integrase [Candidatus Woesearchaeota archaeon]
MDLVELMRKELVRRHYSPKTVDSYVFCVRKFLLWCKANDKDKEPRRITKQDIKDYLAWLCEKGVAASTLNLHQQALKFALLSVLNKKFFVNLPFSKVPAKLPEVLTQEEVVKLFKAIDNPKHSLIVRLMYSSGLRVSELVRLRVRDLELEKGFGWVRKGKGAKDRVFLLASGIKQELSEFIQNNGLGAQDWVFRGRFGHLTTRTVYEVVKQASVKAGLSKRVHPHTLRHSFATHLIENGYDVIRVQSLLGHNSVDTTMVYVHMASPELLGVASPYDSLCENYL